MRIEKGHVAGNELNGQTTARDLGLGRMMSTKKDFIGRVMAGRAGPDRAGPAAPSSASSRSIRRSGCAPARISSASASRRRMENDEGYMTSVAYSPTLGHWIGLGLLKHGPRAHRRAHPRRTIPCATAISRSRSASPGLRRSRRSAPPCLIARDDRAGRRAAPGPASCRRPARRAAASRRQRSPTRDGLGIASLICRGRRRGRARRRRVQGRGSALDLPRPRCGRRIQPAHASGLGRARPVARDRARAAPASRSISPRLGRACRGHRPERRPRSRCVCPAPASATPLPRAA